VRDTAVRMKAIYGHTDHSKYGIIPNIIAILSQLLARWYSGNANVSGVYYVHYETRFAVRNYLSTQYLLSSSPLHCHGIVIGTSYVFRNIYCFIL